ncbi:MAG: hypothetical protein JSR67_17055 [Proteobacteria bacterium]|nr:hypothetical protein [Pseudomonadota bacterium]
MHDATATPSQQPQAVAEVDLPEVIGPHERIKRKGTIHAPLKSALPKSWFEAPLRPGVRKLVCGTLQWGTEATAPPNYLGDYRFTVLEMQRADGHLVFAQIWSEPDSGLCMEVGPGERSDPALQHIADSMRMALLGRGFAIGGNGHNFRKELALQAATDIDSVTNELCALLTEVLGFDGTQAVRFKFVQDSWLSAAHVVRLMTPSLMRSVLRSWDLNPREAPDQPASLHCCEGDLHFRVQLMAEKSPGARQFWEVHFLTEQPVPRDAAQPLIGQVNGSAYLMKACEAQPQHPDPSKTLIRFAVGQDLSGGVTLEHLRSRIREWLHNVRRLCAFASGEKATSPTEADVRRPDGATLQ